MSVTGSATPPAAGERPVTLVTTPRNNVVAETWAVFRKDLLSELRTRQALNTLAVFALATLLLVSMTVVTRGLGLTSMPGPGGASTAGQTQARATLLAGLLWIILFFSGMSGLARAFVKEEDTRTATALRLAAEPLAVLFGKLLFNVALLLAVTLLIAPLFVLLLQAEVADPPLFAAEMALGSIGLASVTTLLAAIVARAESRASLFAVLAFPIVLPVLVIVVNGTAAALIGGPHAASARNQLVGLVSYVMLLVILSTWLFELVWQD